MQTWLENVLLYGLALNVILATVGKVASLLAPRWPSLSGIAAWCAAVGADVTAILDLVGKRKGPPGPGPTAAAVVCGLLVCAGCAGLLGNIPPGESVCVSVSGWGLEAKACGTNNEPVEQIKARADARLRAEKEARDGR